MERLNTSPIYLQRKKETIKTINIIEDRMMNVELEAIEIIKVLEDRVENV